MRRKLGCMPILECEMSCGRTLAHTKIRWEQNWYSRYGLITQHCRTGASPNARKTTRQRISESKQLGKSACRSNITQLSSDENHLDSFTKAKIAGLERFARVCNNFIQFPANKLAKATQIGSASSQTYLFHAFFDFFVCTMHAREGESLGRQRFAKGHES